MSVDLQVYMSSDVLVEDPNAAPDSKPDKNNSRGGLAWHIYELVAVN